MLDRRLCQMAPQSQGLIGERPRRGIWWPNRRITALTPRVRFVRGSEGANPLGSVGPQTKTASDVTRGGFAPRFHSTTSPCVVWRPTCVLFQFFAQEIGRSDIQNAYEARRFLNIVRPSVRK